uniref:DRBM domain-containing protein n=1 Tax=Panagrolaimus sp. JU765 TaxID=591449 RepID=A0AC34RJL0_9BILA
MNSSSLLSIIEELSQKLCSRRPQYEFSEQFSGGLKVFHAKIILNYLDEQLVGNGTSTKKQSAKHLASGNVLLKLVERQDWKQWFPQLETQDDVRKMIQSKLDVIETSKPNPSVVNLCQYCEKSGLNDPVYEVTSSVPGNCNIQCIVAKKFTTQGQGTNEETAKGIAAENMLNLLKEIYNKSIQAQITAPKVYSLTTSDVVMDESEEVLMTKENKDKTCDDIKNALKDEIQENFIEFFENQKDIFTKMYGKEFEWRWYSHKSKNLTKVLESLHSIDVKKQGKQRKLFHEAILQSFFGYGVNEEIAKNEAAKMALNYLQNWIDQRVVIMDNIPRKDGSYKSQSIPSSKSNQLTFNGEPNKSV